MDQAHRGKDPVSFEYKAWADVQSEDDCEEGGEQTGADSLSSVAVDSESPNQ